MCERLTCQHIYTAYDGIQLVGRALSALVDLVSILFVFLIGRRLYDWRAGLVGALLLAAAVLPIQQSHFFTMDNWAAALTTLSMYAAVRASEKGEMPWYALFGLGLGLTLASRINLAPLADGRGRPRSLAGPSSTKQRDNRVGLSARPPGQLPGTTSDSWRGAGGRNLHSHLPSGPTLRLRRLKSSASKASPKTGQEPGIASFWDPSLA
ncbi:MAG: glycosyltransferase family 39 protein [Chloroflexi bacterium]|nr:glycosyltransferase family 39 protein [Chloroflexota bacterium]